MQSFTRTRPCGHLVKLELGLVVEVASEVFRRGVDSGEGLEVVDHLVVEVVDDGAHDLLEELEVQQKAGFVEVFALEGDEDLVVMAVRVLALATIVAEVVAGRKAGFYSYFEHDSGVPSAAASLIESGVEGTWLQLIPYFDCTVLCESLSFALCSAGLFGTALGLLEQRGQDAGQRDEETDDQKAKPHRAPESDVTGGAGLFRDVGVGDAAGDQSEEDEAACEDVEIASHAWFYFTARSILPRGSHY